MSEANAVNGKLSRIQGSLLGGAVGDALGYAVEFSSDSAIRRKYGPAGISRYELRNGVALFSDDTQMTLFTANGLLVDRQRERDGLESDPVQAVYRAYLDWLTTQRRGSVDEDAARVHFLMAEPELYSPRAPGNTCLSALRSGRCGTIERPLNDSKGCGGVMRVAPVGLFYADKSGAEVATLGARMAAITHGHPLGYLSAAGLAALVQRLARDENARARSFAEVTRESLADVREAFGDVSEARGALDTFESLVTRALDYAENADADIDNIVALGEGWVGEEAFAIAVYCVARYPDDFDAAIIASVNHGGDSDSTGAIAGNISGARLGREAIGAKWLDNLELRELIEKVGALLAQ